LKAYHILWLRSQNADNIPPVDELTTDNLTDEWKRYLKNNNRYHQDSDTYDLNDLKPAREDPYGTSSMSVQIARTGTHVSIKNRYNHTVNSPDSTLGNNLDRLQDGLKLATYDLVNRKDLLKNANISLDGRYTNDNHGGIHPYSFEKDNVYYGWYEKIEAGEVTSLPENEYYRLSPELYAKRNSSGEIVNLNNRSQESYESIMEPAEDGYKLSLQERGRPVATFYIELNEKRQQIGLGMVIEGDCLYERVTNRNDFLTSITWAEGAKAERIYYNSSLTSITLAEGAKVDAIYYNDSLTSITLAEGAEARGIYNNCSLTSIALAEGAKIGKISGNHPDLKIIRTNARLGETPNEN
jgi:hypothetical protein